MMHGNTPWGRNDWRLISKPKSHEILTLPYFLALLKENAAIQASETEGQGTGYIGVPGLLKKLRENVGDCWDFKPSHGTIKTEYKETQEQKLTCK